MAVVEPKHILLTSLPLYGHAIPLLHLGVKLTHHHHVTFAVAEDTLKTLREEIAHVEYGVYGPVHLTGIQTTANIPDKHVIDFKYGNPARKLFEEVLPVMREFFLSVPVNVNGTPSETNETIKPKLFTLEGEGIFKPIDVVMADNFLGGPLSLMHSRGVPFYLFNSSHSWLALAFLTLDVEDPESFKLSAKCTPNFVRRSVGSKFLDINLEANKDLLMDNCHNMHLASGIVANGVREAEDAVIAELLRHEKMGKMRTFCVGPLAAESVKQRTVKKPEEEVIKKWLDRQQNQSVVYVSFGSIAVPIPEEIKEIGEALLLLQAPFIWSLKAKLQAAIQIGTDPVSRDFLIVPWAPQKEILAHPATKVFVTHCGWNSALETLTYGVPVVAWPMFADQLINAEWLEEEGVGKLIHGTGLMRQRIVPGEEIASVLREVMGVEEGKENSYTRHRNWQRKIRTALDVGGTSYQELAELVKLF
ncbi:putative UDP-glycosyltransferase 72D1 [Hypsibius exemplaris]|uniref:UDP-glucuronosyltransferase n=1 Tax=Hypsibius exemplaris TaxID=2072580 RepID=A0A1W0X5D1_HYPEX|nr:putative UDP-glycosyltransferase 72D1 [Hypsibius exemplaris]